MATKTLCLWYLAFRKGMVPLGVLIHFTVSFCTVNCFFFEFEIGSKVSSPELFSPTELSPQALSPLPPAPSTATTALTVPGTVVRQCVQLCIRHYDKIHLYKGASYTHTHKKLSNKLEQHCNCRNASVHFHFTTLPHQTNPHLHPRATVHQAIPSTPTTSLAPHICPIAKANGPSLNHHKAPPKQII